MNFPKVIFTNSTQLESVPIQIGQILVCKDDEKVFIDVKDDKRIGISDRAITDAVKQAGSDFIKDFNVYGDVISFTMGDGTVVSYKDKDTKYGLASDTTDGLLSKGDFTKLKGIATGANKYTLPSASSTTLGGVKTGYSTNGKNYSVQIDSSSNLFVNVPWTDTNTVYTVASTTANGLLSKEDKTKLDGIAAKANNYSLPVATSSVRGGVKIGYAANGKNYPVQLSNEQMFVNVPWTDTNTTYANMKAATASAAGKAGLVPAPTAGKQTSFLRGDGQWVIPTNTTYNVATASANGLLSAHDKTWIDGKFRRYVYGSDTNDTTHNGYYKIASVNTTSTYTSHILKLRIFSDNFTNFAIAPISELEIVFRTNAANSTPTIYVYTNVNGANSALWNYLYIKYNNTNTSNWTFTLYFNKTAAWQKIVVDVLGEGKRSSTASSSNYQSVYTMDNSNTFVASITETGFNVAKLSIALAGHTVGNSSVPIYLNKGIPTAVTGLTTNRTTSTFLAGNQGTCIINSTAGAGAYTMLAKMNSANGYFTEGVYQTKYLLQYTAKATVDAKTNAVTKTVTLLDEAGNSQFPGTVTAPTFAGNASTADKLKTARNIKITGASSGNANFDGSGNISIQTIRNSCIVGQTGNSSNTTSKPWFKVASYTITTTNTDVDLTLHVTSSDTSGGSLSTDQKAQRTGVLHLHARTGNTAKNITACTLKWEYVNSGINISNFVAAYHSTNGIIELWVKCTTPWEKYRFTVIDEGFGGSNNNLFTLYNTLGDGSVASITSGYTQVVSSLSNVNGVGNVVSVRSSFGLYSGTAGSFSQTTILIPSGYNKYFLIFRTKQRNWDSYDYAVISPVFDISSTTPVGLFDITGLKKIIKAYNGTTGSNNNMGLGYIHWKIDDNRIKFDAGEYTAGPTTNGISLNCTSLACVAGGAEASVTAIFFN